MSISIIPSVNFHLWEPCNMRCKFCFATFQDVKKQLLPKGHLPKNQAIDLVHQIADFGFRKITFAGGEPTLCPWLVDLITIAKKKGLLTNVVTNGYSLAKSKDIIKHYQGITDWITVSIDSFYDGVNIFSGRAFVGKKPLDIQDYLELSNQVQELEIGFKTNSVIHRFNFKERLSANMQALAPERWKVFQVLPIKGQNDKFIDEFSISDEEFKFFLSQNEHPNLIVEDNNAMTNSYAMIDPSGRFFSNQTGAHQYSDFILEQGIEKSYAQMNYSVEKFLGRDGLYY